MNYEPLSKIFYREPERYGELYAARFHSESACHLDFFIGEVPAFFLLTNETVSLLASIYKEDKKLTQLRNELPPVAIQQFLLNSLVEEIVLTNNIEGISSTRREIETVLESLRRTDKRKRFQGLVQKYDLLQTSERIPLQTPEDVRRLYNDLVLDEVCEEDRENRPDGKVFRKDILHVTSATGKVLHSGVFPEEKIRRCMESALAFLNGEESNALIRLSLFHYLFGYIHPFYDGNGRTSRFISSYFISRELDPLAGYRLSYTIKEESAAYYRGFKLCNDPKNKGDLTPFLLMFLGLIERSVKELAQALEKRRQRLQYYSSLCVEYLHTDEKMFPLYHLLIQASLFDQKGVSAQIMCSVLEISRPTLTSRLHGIQPPELLSVAIEDHKRYYSLNLSLLDDMALGREEHLRY